MITELSSFPNLSDLSDPATPTMPAPDLDLPVVRSLWISEDGHELTDLVDPPIAGLPVSLRDAQGIELARTTTDPAGSYRFDDVAGGDYTVVFTAPRDSSAAIDRRNASHRQPTSYWPGDSVVPTPVHLWLSLSRTHFQLLGTLA